MATTFDNEALYALSYMNGMALESLKLYEFNKRDALFRNLKKEMRALLQKVQHDDLSFMTKKELATLIKKVRTLHDGFYSNLSKDLLEMFSDFTVKSIAAAKQTWVPIALADNDDEEDEEVDPDTYIEEHAPKEGGTIPLGAVLSGAAFLALMLRTPVSGVGYTYEQMLKNLGETSRKKFESEVLRAYATGGTTRSDLIQMFVGDPQTKQGTNGAINTLHNHVRAVIDTGLEFSASQATAAVTSMVDGDKYQWVSVMDGRTSRICIGLNRKIFVYGNGPIPPAHFGCRSKIIPWRGKERGGVVSVFDEKNTYFEAIREYQKNHGMIDTNGKYKANVELRTTVYFQDLLDNLKKVNQNGNQA